MLFAPSRLSSALVMVLQHKYVARCDSQLLPTTPSITSERSERQNPNNYFSNSLTPLPTRSANTTPMSLNVADMPSFDSPDPYPDFKAPKLAELLASKEKECEELRESLSELKNSLDNAEKNLENADAGLHQALSKERSRYEDCLRMEERLQDQEKVELTLRSANLEIEKLQKSLADCHWEAQVREEAFEAEKLAWDEERRRFQSRISSLVESLKEAHAREGASPTDNALWEKTNRKIAIPPHGDKPECELCELVPGYVETLGTMEFAIEGLNNELDELHHAYSEVVNRNNKLQEIVQQLDQQLSEREPPQILQESLQSEISHSSPSGQIQSTLRSSINPSISLNSEVEQLKQTNQNLNHYLEQLLDRIIGLPAFEHVLKMDFGAIRNDYAPCQCSNLRVRRKVSSSIAMRALEKLKATKAAISKRFNESASSGDHALAKPFLKITNSPPDFVKMHPYASSM